MKELVDFPLEDLAMDYFKFNDELVRIKKKIDVVVSKKPYLQSIAHQVRRSGLNLVAIDVVEFALRNFLMLVQPDEEGARCILQVMPKCSILVVVKGQHIYLVRRIGIGSDKLLEQDENLEFTAEINKSFNYYRSQLGQELPRWITLAPVPNVTVVVVLAPT